MVITIDTDENHQIGKKPAHPSDELQMNPNTLILCELCGE
jgi:hypothetical protein